MYIAIYSENFYGLKIVNQKHNSLSIKLDLLKLPDIAFPAYQKACTDLNSVFEAKRMKM